MRIMDIISTPGSPERANEDRSGARGTVGWVVDGATELYDDAVLPAESDVQWLVDFLTGELTAAGEARYQGPSQVLLRELAEKTEREQRRLSFPSDRTPPACSIAVIVDAGEESYDISRIGDVTAVLSGDREERDLVFATTYFDQREASAVDTARHGCLSGAEIREAMVQRRHHTMTGGDEESVFSGHPRRVLRPRTLCGKWNEVSQLLLCTDGFARAVTDYALYASWPEMVRAASQHGLAHIEQSVRRMELDAADQTRHRFKRADDASALLLAPDPT